MNDKKLRLCRFCLGPRLCMKVECTRLKRAEYEKKVLKQSFHFLDDGIRDIVYRCRDLGKITVSSCDGHGKAPGYVTFWLEEDRDCMLKEFASLKPIPDVLLTGQYGPLYRMLIEPQFLNWSPVSGWTKAYLNDMVRGMRALSGFEP